MAERGRRCTRVAMDLAERISSGSPGTHRQSPQATCARDLDCVRGGVSAGYWLHRMAERLADPNWQPSAPGDFAALRQNIAQQFDPAGCDFSRRFNHCVFRVQRRSQEATLFAKVGQLREHAHRRHGGRHGSVLLVYRRTIGFYRGWQVEESILARRDFGDIGRLGRARRGFVGRRRYHLLRKVIHLGDLCNLCRRRPAAPSNKARPS